MSFIFLRLFALRTVEVVALDVKDVKWKTYNFGPDFGKRYVELCVDLNKVNRLKLGNWKPPPITASSRSEITPRMRCLMRTSTSNCTCLSWGKNPREGK